MADKVKVLVSKKSDLVVLGFNDFTGLLSKLGSYGIKGGYPAEVFETLFTGVRPVDMDTVDFKTQFQEELKKVTENLQKSVTPETQADGFVEPESTEKAQAAEQDATTSAFEGYNPKGPSKF